ncbi:hypothetical protein QNO07_01205 [Streptomyces sp. 549]|uniref:hypothetical protein n=1 Tax=Streptomyces sp. 549 TaxID=3049076 RepID=UPI0024C376FC|nr:hypothetical protein [Streptomyces sp. 549]MDK1472058.1 hypothetical protein [Streptomyces sp. 549]
MAAEEKRAWIMLAVTVAAYAAYLAVVLGGAAGGPLAEASYAAALLWTIGASVAAAIVLNVVLGVDSPARTERPDERDREIHRFGEYTGQSMLVVGGIAGLVLAMAEVAHFWIANALFLAFVLSAVTGATAKVAAYRQGSPTC